MKLTYKSAKLTYKSMFGYGLMVIVLLAVTAPVLANTTPAGKLLNLSFSSNTGYTVQTAQPLSKGVTVNQLHPGEENWYSYSRASFGDPNFSWISLAMRLENGANVSSEQVNFQVFADKLTGSLSETAALPEESLGLGIPSPLPMADQSLVETFWTGQMDEGAQYYVRIFNHSPFELEYHLEAKAEQPAVSGAIPASLNSTMNRAEALNARQMVWSLTAQAIEHQSAAEAAVWLQNAQAVGWIITEGTAPENAPKPGEADRQMLWNLTAQALEGQDAEAAARWLAQADALGWLAVPLNTLKNPADDLRLENTGDDDDGGGGDSELPPAQPVPPDEPETYTPINIYPNNPLTFDFSHVNSGRLPPDGEHWYELIRDDLDDDLIEDLALTMFFTPSQGYLSNRVNFELFPAGQYHIWSRGDADYMENFGAGMWVSRDKDPNTSERLWSGSLVDGDRYLLKIKNGTAEVVDYYLFPKDITNAELGNPTLHKSDNLNGRVAPASSPPTRPGPPPEPGAGPPEAVPLEIGLTKGALEAGEEMWYRFYYSDDHNKESPEHDFIFTLTNTPRDDIRARHADFEIYPGNQLHLWIRGTIDELSPLGTSSPALYPDLDDERSLQVLWNGQLREDHVYYVKVYNHDIGPLEYKLEVRGGP
jgi:hypothetical protein